MSKKYKLTKETKQSGSTTLYQIEAITSFGNVKKGEKGGWIEKEANLSQLGNAWVSGDARVFGKIKLTQGCFFGWKNKDKELTFIDNDDIQLIGKGDCKFEYYDDKPEKMIELSNGKKVSESTVLEALRSLTK